MKTLIEIQKMKDKVDVDKNTYHGMTYEQGIENALAWVLEQMDDAESQEFEEQF